MRKLRYNVATSLDGFIAGPNGEYDWIVADNSFDFDALFREFDTFVLGRKTFETLLAQGAENPLAGKRVYVASHTLPMSNEPGVVVVAENIVDLITSLKEERGKDIWLFGGAELAGTLLSAGLLDTIEVAVMPVVLTCGIPLLPQGKIHRLSLYDAKGLPSGIQLLSYNVTYDV
jgi:dihydrofolate reductase